MAKTTKWSELHEAVTPFQVVAVSARDGRGLDKLLASVEAGLLAQCSRVDCVLPYSCAALLAEVHKTGTIEVEEYVADGTRLVAYVPGSLRNRLEKAASVFEVDIEAAPRATPEAGDKKSRLKR